MISEEIRKFHSLLPEGIELVAVSKFHPAEAIREAYDAGQRIFGESRVQELAAKVTVLPEDIRWHFIGHLQTNKVKKLVSLRPAMIESVDSVRLLETVDSAAETEGFVARVLMQVHVAREETKFGFYPEELLEFFRGKGFEKLRSTHICGVMGMASNTDDEDRVRDDFRAIHDVFKQIASDESLGLRGFNVLSMGMSGDWKTAVEEGSTLVRIGSAIFGPRNY